MTVNNLYMQRLINNLKLENSLRENKKDKISTLILKLSGKAYVNFD